MPTTYEVHECIRATAAMVWGDEAAERELRVTELDEERWLLVADTQEAWVVDCTKFNVAEQRSSAELAATLHTQDDAHTYTVWCDGHRAARAEDYTVPEVNLVRRLLKEHELCDTIGGF
jgi:hypothetical protein